MTDATKEMLRQKGPDFSRESIATSFMLDVAGHHMLGVARVLEQALAPWVLGRASLEASARAAWALDPGLTEQQRLERTYGIILDDLNNVDSESRSKAVAARRAEFLKELADRGITISHRKLVEAVPGKTRLVEEALGMGVWYGEFSETVHSRHDTGQLFASLAQVAGAVPGVPDPRADTLVPCIVWAYGAAVWRFFITRDLTRDGLEDALSEAGQVMSFPPRFWEQRPQPQR